MTRKRFAYIFISALIVAGLAGWYGLGQRATQPAGPNAEINRGAPKTGEAVCLSGKQRKADKGEIDWFMKILQRCKLVVGVKADYKPWGFRDDSGNLVGMEPDMAKDVAQALGVALELVPVTSANRMRLLQQGKIDLIIATMSNVVERRSVVGIVEPNYYTSGINVLSPKSLRLHDWPDLNDKPVCGVQGAFFNRSEELNSARVIPFATVEEALQTLREGRCIAFVYDSALLTSVRQTSNDYDDYEMPFETKKETPWAVAVPLAELTRKWGRYMSRMVNCWHASGRLLELEEKWGISPSEYLKEQKNMREPDCLPPG